MAAEFAPLAGACSPCALGYVAGMPGILLLDSSGFVLRKNQIAEKLLTEQSVLSVRNDRLTTPYRLLQQWLDRETVRAAADGASMNRGACSARFSARDGMVDLALTLLPRARV
ncbi:hypothetical protein RZS08_25875, partial [Arthrospira platensis SPKY1]|nr:hypothetical protein [Arthrospira platensis SPKY1]